MSTHRERSDWLREVSFAPRFPWRPELELGPNWLMMRMLVENSDPRATLGNLRVEFQLPLPPDVCDGGRVEFFEFVRYAVHMAILHEVDEFLLVRGDKRWDPHAAGDHNVASAYPWVERPRVEHITLTVGEGEKRP